MKKSTFAHGSAEVWDDVWEGAETTYSDFPVTQNQVFEHVKISKLREIFPKGKFKLLEVGCGSAFVSLYFAKQGNSVTCFDNNANILKVAKENFLKEKTRGKFVLADAEKLPFRDNYFDVVASFGLLEHFNDPTKAIAEMVRVTKVGGLFFADIVPRRFSVQSIGNIFNFFASLFYGALKVQPLKGLQKGIRNFRPLYYENSLGWQQYKKIIERSGVSAVVVHGNRPFARLTLPKILDRVYASVLKLFIPLWRLFDEHGGPIAKFWGAGWWFWGTRN